MAHDRLHSYRDGHDDLDDRGADDSDVTRRASSSDDGYADSHIDSSPPKQHVPSTPPTQDGSFLSSQEATPTTMISSRKERVRYSWQSIHDDEPNRPRIHIVKIVSNTATASAASPQGEALAFSMSPAGKRIAAYNSARLFVFQTAALPVNVSHEYALRRRPLAVELCDEANFLAVLADEHTINVYDLSHNQTRRLRTIRTDLPTNTIALSSTGGLVAAAYEGGVEVFSLAAKALVTDRRAVRAPKMDKLVFSQDDSTLLGTTTRIFTSSTVIVSVPVFPSAASGVPSHDELQEAWCTGMLEPENIKNSSHATFMRHDGVMTNDELFAWNGLEDTFGLLTTDDMTYSQVDFPVAISPPLSTCGGLGAAIHHTPSIDEHGKIVAMIVNDRTVRLYIVPQELTDGETKIEAHSIDHELDEEYGCPFTDLRWVHSRLNLPAAAHSLHQIRGRLVVTSPGGLVDPDQVESGVDDVEGGRIILFDFDPHFAGQPGQTFVFNVGKAPPLTLEEEEMDVADEIALVRRRTVTSTRSGTLGKKTPSLGRAATTVSRRQEDSPYRNSSPAVSMQHLSVNYSPWRNRRGNPSVISLSADASRSLPDLLETSELSAEPIEDPYVQGAPRSVMSLERAATAANAHRFQALEEQEAESERPGDLPLPAYSEMPNQPLPGRYRALAGLDIPAVGRHVQQNGSPTSAVATAPPVVPNHQFPPSSSTLSPAHGLPLHMNSNGHNVSPVTSSAQSISVSDWSVSPATVRNAPRMPLRTQPSWETISTNAPTYTQPPSTLRSQPSWESNGTLNFFSPEMTQGSQTAPTSPEHMQPPQTVHGLGLSDFRHSLLVPQDRSAEERPHTTASDSQLREHSMNYQRQHSTGYQRRPPHVEAMQAVNHFAAHNPASSNDLTQQHSNASTSAISAVSTISSNNSTPRPPNSAGGVAYPVTNWYPPTPPTPPTHRPSFNTRSKSAGFPPSRAGSTARSLFILSSSRTGRETESDDDSRHIASLRRSKSAGTGRKAWFARKKVQEERYGADALPTRGNGIREDLAAYEAQGKRCVLM